MTKIIMEQAHRCEHCGARLNSYNSRLSKGLVVALLKFKQSVVKKGTNCIHLQTECNFTINEYNNFQRLKNHGLVEKFIDFETKMHKLGFWSLTDKGKDFCVNKISIPESVRTFRNQIVSESENLIYISDITGNEYEKYWDDKFDYLESAGNVSFEQGKLF